MSEPCPVVVSERYRLIRELGSGGMASVYLAEDLRHHRQVALKVMKPEIARAIGHDRFLREIEIAARLNHPHVLALFDSGADNESLFYVMPYIAGESLRARLDREKQLPIEDAVRLTREIASALGHAHQHGLVHRDIKPENVLLADGIALVADFGIARAINMSDGSDETQLATRVGAILGTPRYMSPEQAAGASVDERTDLYALACVLYEMLAGQPPFVAPSVDTLIRMHMTAEPRPVTELRPSVPSGVAPVIAKALSKSPANRYATVALFAEALTAAAGGWRTPTETISQNNLPKQRTRFIGRENEVAECARLLGDSKLLTLTGIGGCGKTRLAIRLAESLLPSFPDGVWFADLAPLSDGDRVLETVAAAMSVQEAAGKDLRDALARHARGKRLLLVLDNCEHLLSSCAAVADLLLNAAAEVQMVATSREGFGIQGERIFAVRSLSVPPLETAGSVAAIQSSEAVNLFVDRARLAAGDFSLNEKNAASVAEICRRLDGIPLALELAAARVKILSVDQIRSKLDDRFRLLTGGTSALPRHQTLRATIQWSYEQLSDREQRLLRQLAVFAGGWTLESATRVAADEADEFEMMDLLSRLVDKSLVFVERERTTEPRYGMLDTVRQYTQERLAESGEADPVRRRHAAEFLGLAERAYKERFAHEEHWAGILEIEQDNLRTGLNTLREGDVERYLECVGALGWFWQARSHLIEGRGRLLTAVAVSASEPSRLARARALWWAAHTMGWQGDAKMGRPWMEQALQMWRDLGDLSEVAIALEGIGWIQFLGGDDETACATFEECVRLQRQLGDQVLLNRAKVALAQVLVALNRVEEARSLARDIIAFSEPRDDRRSLHLGWHYFGDCALIEGKCEESLRHYRKSLALAQAIGDRMEMSFEVQGVAMSLAGLGDAEGALRLAGAAKGELDRLGVDLHMRFWDVLMDRYMGAAKQALGSETADRVWTEGRRVPFDQVVALALDASVDVDKDTRRLG